VRRVIVRSESEIQTLINWTNNGSAKPHRTSFRIRVCETGRTPLSLAIDLKKSLISFAIANIYSVE
jgi:hypothetical protein